MLNNPVDIRSEKSPIPRVPDSQYALAPLIPETQSSDSNSIHAKIEPVSGGEIQRSFKEQLRSLCDQGRTLGLHAGNLRSEISVLMTGISIASRDSSDTEEKIALRHQLLSKHEEYNETIVQLRNVKRKIEETKKMASTPWDPSITTQIVTYSN